MQVETDMNGPFVRYPEEISLLTGTLQEMKEMDAQVCKRRMLQVEREAGPEPW